MSSNSESDALLAALTRHTVTPAAFMAVTTSETVSPHHHTLSNSVIACLLATFGNAIVAGGLMTQKYVHLKYQKTNRKFYHIPLWYFGLAILCVGELGNFSAYGFGAASLVAPLGATGVIFNLILARAIFNEKLYVGSLLGCFVAVSGTVVLVLSNVSRETVVTPLNVYEALQSPSFLLYGTLETTALLICVIAIFFLHVRSKILYLTAANIVCSITVISTKAASGFIVYATRTSTDKLWRSPALLISIFFVCTTGPISVYFLNLAMKHYDANTVIPTNFVMFTVSAVLAGSFFYGEMTDIGTSNLIGFASGLLLCILGVLLINLPYATPNFSLLGFTRISQVLKVPVFAQSQRTLWLADQELLLSPADRTSLS